MTLPRFSVTGLVHGVGKINHVVSAADKQAAWDRFKRAHSGKQCTFISIEGAWVHTLGDPT